MSGPWLRRRLIPGGVPASTASPRHELTDSVPSPRFIGKAGAARPDARGSVPDRLDGSRPPRLQPVHRLPCAAAKAYPRPLLG
jgi:hypothetical protein